MDRMKSVFARCRRENRRALVVFVTCGCPDLAGSEMVIERAIESGADIIELGVPFSDPMADGAVIQQASRRALDGGTKFADILALAGRIRRKFPAVGLILFSYYNLLFQYGVEKTAAEAAGLGLDGFLCVDLPFEEREEFKPVCDRHQLHLIPLLSPATSIERAEAITRDAAGFVYCVTVRGVTGERAALPADLAGRLKMLRRVSPAPVAAGFGIGTPEAARRAAEHADAVVVGSAVVKITLSGRPVDEIATESGKLLASLAQALSGISDRSCS